MNDDDVRVLFSGLPVKYSGLAIPAPTKSSEVNFEASAACVAHLVCALKGDVKFRSGDHLATLNAAKADMRKSKLETYDSTFDSVLETLPMQQQRLITRSRETGQFLSVMPSATHGTLLSALEFRDALSYHYSIEPSNIQPRCDGCGAKISLDHGLTCMKGGLINARHNGIGDELCDLASKALSPSAVRDEPSIFLGRSVDGNNVNVSETMQQTAPAVERNLNKTVEGGERGDVLIRGLWENGTDAIIDVRDTNLDAKSYRDKDSEKSPAQQEREKKKKYLQACLDQRRHFLPFVMSTDGLLGHEAKFVVY